MINHVRTLLMNTAQGGYPPTFPGEEYVPAFQPKRLTRGLRLARQLLFGSAPDRLMLNYRMRQLMELLHSTELDEYVYLLDSRVTYLPLSSVFFDDVFKLEIQQLGGSGDPLYIRGTHDPNESAGQLEQVWDLTVTDDAALVVKRRPPVKTTPVTIDYTKGLCTPVPLTGTSLTAQFHQVPDGTYWKITSRARPRTDLMQLLSQLVSAFGEQGDQEVFPPLAPEPVATFERVWRHHELAPYRYSALLLAMAWKINGLPQEPA